MKMKFIIAALCILCAVMSHGQSKVFKEVSDEISSQMKIITQDESLIGYLVFSQLEKASKDSFNYQIKIMDENLNDIGKLDFRERNLELQAVSFDQDILCLVYLKSDMSDIKKATYKEIRNAVDFGKNEVYRQLINLQGQIIHTASQKVELTLKEGIAYVKNTNPSTLPGRLKHRVVLKNIPGKGFALFYGDENKAYLTAVDIAGKELWQKTIPDAEAYGLLTTSSEVYLLSKKKHEMKEGGYELAGYKATDGTIYSRYELEDKQGRQLKVLSFETDLVSGKPTLSGLIINPSRGNSFYSVSGLHKGAYEGVFTVTLNGPQKNEIKERYSYWNDGTKSPEIKTNGMIADGKKYPRYTTAVRDFKGNTYFIGSSYLRKARVGGIIASVITLPLMVPPIILMAPGTHKSKQTDVVILRQDSLGRINYENTIDGSDSRYVPSKVDFSYYGGRGFYTVTNAATQANFLIVDEAKSAVIYNVQKKKVVRKVPHREGAVSTYIFPAKEGHIMVMEYNRKAKETKLSIEALQ